MTYRCHTSFAIFVTKGGNSEKEFLEWYIMPKIQSIGVLWNKRAGAWQGHYYA